MRDPADPRAVRSRARLLDAAVDVMLRDGVEATSIKAIAERARVTRSTVYNHWTDRTALVVDALAHLSTSEAARRGLATPDAAPDASPAPESGLDRVRRLVTGLARALDGDWGTIAAGLAYAAERDPELGDAHRRWVEGRREGLAQAVEEAKADGRLRSDLDTSWAVTLLVGPLYYERLVLHRRLGDDRIAAHLEQTLAVLVAPAETGAHPAAPAGT